VPLNQFLVQRAMNTGDTAQITTFDIVVNEGTHRTEVLGAMTNLANKGLIYPVAKKDSYHPWTFIVNPIFQDFKAFAQGQFDATLEDLLMVNIGRGETPFLSALRGLIKV